MHSNLNIIFYPRQVEGRREVHDDITPCWWILVYTTDESFINAFGKTADECGVERSWTKLANDQYIEGYRVVHGEVDLYKHSVMYRNVTIYKTGAGAGDIEITRNQAWNSFIRRVSIKNHVTLMSTLPSVEEIQTRIESINQTPSVAQPEEDDPMGGDTSELIDNTGAVGAKGDGKGDGKGKDGKVNEKKRKSGAMTMGSTAEDEVSELTEDVHLYCSGLDKYEDMKMVEYKALADKLESKAKDFRTDGCFGTGRNCAQLVANLKQMSQFVVACQKIVPGKKYGFNHLQDSVGSHQERRHVQVHHAANSL